MAPELLQLLACPKCPERPELRQDGDWLICTQCGCGYRIIDGIPDLLPEDAVSPEDLAKEKKK